MQAANSSRLSDDEIRQRATELLHSVGVNTAAKTLGIGRMTVLGLASGAPVMPATFALIRERAQRDQPAPAKKGAKKP